MAFELTTVLDQDQAEALAQFVKRVSFSQVRESSQSDHEAYLMMDGFCSLRRSLDEAGYSPR